MRFQEPCHPERSEGTHLSVAKELPSFNPLTPFAKELSLILEYARLSVVSNLDK